MTLINDVNLYPFGYDRFSQQYFPGKHEHYSVYPDCGGLNQVIVTMHFVKFTSTESFEHAEACLRQWIKENPLESPHNLWWGRVRQADAANG